jgi:hypothetical protein
MPTPLQNLRCERDLWSSAMAKARAEGRTLSDVIREFLRAYVR